MTSDSGEAATSSLATDGGVLTTDEQLFLDFFERVRQNALHLDIGVSRADIEFYVCWGAERWLHRFDPGRARLEGNQPQVSEAMAKIRATMSM